MALHEHLKQLAHHNAVVESSLRDAVSHLSVATNEDPTSSSRSSRLTTKKRKRCCIGLRNSTVAQAKTSLVNLIEQQSCNSHMPDPGNKRLPEIAQGVQEAKTWDRISEETGASPLTCFSVYQRFDPSPPNYLLVMLSRYHKAPVSWSAHEDALLAAAVKVRSRVLTGPGLTRVIFLRPLDNVLVRGFVSRRRLTRRIGCNAVSAGKSPCRCDPCVARGRLVPTTSA
jgi:hypothetical protein